jgi:hypothetical protein
MATTAEAHANCCTNCIKQQIHRYAQLLTMNLSTPKLLKKLTNFGWKGFAAAV